MGDFISPAVVAELTGLSEGSLANLRYYGTGPKFYKPSPRKVLYRHSEVMRWLESRARTRTSSR